MGATPLLDTYSCRYSAFYSSCINSHYRKRLVFTIVRWRKSITAYVHYKLPYGVDYDVTDEYGEMIEIATILSVPKTLCIGTSENKDTIIMEIDENGVIKDWKFNVSDFVD